MNTRCVIGIGCDDHGDQIAGLLVARQVAVRSNGTIDAIESSGTPAHLVRSWRDRMSVVVVEAMPGDEPGVVHHTRQHPRQTGFGCSPTRLSARLRDALALGSLPDRLTVITIEAQCFAKDAPVSQEVLRAVATVAAGIAPRPPRMPAPVAVPVLVTGAAVATPASPVAVPGRRSDHTLTHTRGAVRPHHRPGHVGLPSDTL